MWSVCRDGRGEGDDVELGQRRVKDGGYYLKRWGFGWAKDKWAEECRDGLGLFGGFKFWIIKTKGPFG